MELKIGILEQAFDPTKTKMTCISKHKYADVHLAFAIGGAFISFADLSANDGTYSDKESQFEALTELGENIAKAWNEKYNLK